MRFPKSITDIDASWLTEALARGGVLGGARVESVGVEQIGEGSGFAGELARLRPRYADPGQALPQTMIAKLPTQGEGRELFIAGGIYATEALFYRDLASAVPLRVPRCYYNGMDLAAGDFALLLEDLAPGRQGDQIASCSRAQAEMVVEGLATLHAALWNSPRLAECAWLTQYAEGRKGIAAVYPFIWQAAESRVGALLSPKVRAIAGALQPLLPAAFDGLATPPVTLVHGDYRLDNMLFDLAGEEGFALIDWQAAAPYRGAADLAYFFTGSLKPQDRRQWQEGLVGAYLDRLRDQGVRGYDRETCRRDMALGLLTQLLVTVLLMSGADLSVEDDRGVQLARAVLERTNAIFEDTDFDFILKS
jgi:Ser/Thr protein kinase RdoA (MazF antagonist)